MNDYNITNDFLEIVSGRPNTTIAYQEAAKDVADGGIKTMGHLNAFVKTIESIASADAVRDERISGSKGNIKSFKGYENIETSLKFLKKHVGDLEMVKNLETIKKSLENNQSQYADAYTRDARLAIHEYESAMYILVTGLSFCMAANVNIEADNSGKIKVTKKDALDHGVIDKSIADMATQLSAPKHKEYITEIIKAHDDAKTTPIKEGMSYTEAKALETFDAVMTIGRAGKKVVSFAIGAFNAIKNSLFGIIPLIRSIMYLRYKKKADTILALDKQCYFIQQNVERLERIQDMDPEKKKAVIKKQKAIIEAYRKKSEKLRAELCDGESEAAAEIKKNDAQVAQASPKDDDYVLEMYDGTGLTMLLAE